MSNINDQRRTLLKGVAVTTAAASIPLTTSAAIMPAFDAMQQAEFPMPDFDSAVGDSISIRSADGIARKAEIVEVGELDFDCSRHKRPAYLRARSKVVRFQVEDAEAFSNEVYQLSHATLGHMDLLLSVVPDADGVLGLEAVFN